MMFPVGLAGERADGLYRYILPCRGLCRCGLQEWTTGVAAGAAAALMVDHGLSSTSQLLSQPELGALQAALLKLGQPLELTRIA